MEGQRRRAISGLFTVCSQAYGDEDRWKENLVGVSLKKLHTEAKSSTETGHCAISSPSCTLFPVKTASDRSNEIEKVLTIATEIQCAFV